MKFAAGWGDVFIRGFTPPRLAFRFAPCEPTLPLQGRVKKRDISTQRMSSQCPNRPPPTTCISNSAGCATTRICGSATTPRAFCRPVPIRPRCFRI